MDLRKAWQENASLYLWYLQHVITFVMRGYVHCTGYVYSWYGEHSTDRKLLELRHRRCPKKVFFTAFPELGVEEKSPKIQRVLLLRKISEGFLR